MYYKLKNAITRKQVGIQFQTKGFVDGYDIDGPNSRVHLDYDVFPSFVPDLRFELEEKAKLTDVVKPDNISAKGFLINEKVKNIFDQCNLPEHRYYEASLLDHDGHILPYYWLHLISNDYQMIDFEKSVFRKSVFSLKSSDIKSESIIQVKDLNDYQEKNLELKHESYVVLDILKVSNISNFDMLYFSKLDIRFAYISEKLATMLKKAKVTGIDIIEEPDMMDV